MKARSTLSTTAGPYLKGIDLTRQAAPHTTTLLKCRRLLEEKGLTVAIFAAINKHLADKGQLMRAGATVIGTAANVHDVTQAQGLLHGEETDVLGEAGYQGVEKREENQDLAVTWHIALQHGKRKALPKAPWGEWMERIEQAKARIRAKVEHPFHGVKNLFHHRKTRYMGLDKNTKQLYTLFCLANLVLARKWLLAPATQIASVG